MCFYGENNECYNRKKDNPCYVLQHKQHPLSTGSVNRPLSHLTSACGVCHGIIIPNTACFVKTSAGGLLFLQKRKWPPLAVGFPQSGALR